jgi:hypothetical protein
MYGKLEDISRLNREIVVRITEVNVPKRVIWAVSAIGTKYTISVAGLDPLVAIPDIGEEWLIESSKDYQWRLVKRFENGSETTSLDSLRAGDRRLESNGLFIATKKGVVLNSELTLQNRDDVVTRPDSVTLFAQDGELRIATPDGKTWKVVLEPLE